MALSELSHSQPYSAREAENMLAYFYPSMRHHIGSVTKDSSVLTNIIPVAYFSSAPYLEDSSAVVTGAGIPAMMTAVPRSTAGRGKNAVIANIPAGIASSRTAT